MAARAFPVLYSFDVERSARFYVELGFREVFRLPPEGEAGYVGLGLGESRIGIVSSLWPEDLFGERVGAGLRTELFVYVDDVDETVERLRARHVRVMREPQDMQWGERVAYVADPDGNPVALAVPSHERPAGAP